jgi:hypothetical protein
VRHLNPEDLARLVDEPPRREEEDHLRACLACRRELSGLREQTAALAALPSDEPAPGAWEALEAALVREALIRPARPRPAWLVHPGARVAAAVLLFVLGGAAGATLWSGRTGDGASGVSASVDAGSSQHAGREMSEPPARARVRPLNPVDPQVEPIERAPPRSDRVRLASSGETAAPGRRSPAPRMEPAPQRTAPVAAARALAELAEAQGAYVAALQRYAALVDANSGADPETRLAVLDQLVVLTGEALERVPGDPVINGYLMAALSERDQVRREVEAARNVTWF